MDYKDVKPLSRREALKVLAAASGATALATLPDRWQSPVVKVGTLPTFAQTSPFSYPFSNNVDIRVEENGNVIDATWFEDQGWVGVYINPGVVDTQDNDGRRPWRRLKRRNVGAPTWSGTIVVFITITFTVVGNLGDDQLPTGPLHCYGYGAHNNNTYNGQLSNNIQNGRVVFAFPIPVGFIGFFFFSCFFPRIIVLESGEELDSSFYFGPCLYGPHSHYGDDDEDDEIDDEVEETDGVQVGAFRITFRGVTYNNGSSTWRYRVEELNAPPPDLSEWVLELPLLTCGAIVSSSPSGTEVSPHSGSNITGIQWPLAGSFTSGDFEVEVSGDVVVGLVKVAVKDSNGTVGIAQISGPICQEEVDEVTLENCYRIAFLGATDNGNGTSTWRYFVEELPCAQDLSNWVLALPFSCTSIVAASPEPWEAVTPDPNAQLDGIKWETGAGFQQGTFEVVLLGSLDVDLGIGPVDVAAKGPDVAFGQINGPVCL